MTDQPPSPPTPSPMPTAAASSSAEDRVLATTSQLATSIEDATGLSLAPADIETLLLELDRHEYVEWTAVTRTGDYVWDLSESPERVADAIATAVADRVEVWARAKLQRED